MTASDAPPASTLSFLQRLVLWALRGYKLLFSPLFAGSCRFVPSCSEYAADAIRHYGVPRGSWLAIRRLAKCHPFGAHGFDPVTRPGAQACATGTPVGQSRRRA